MTNAKTTTDGSAARPAIDDGVQSADSCRDASVADVIQQTPIDIGSSTMEAIAKRQEIISTLDQIIHEIRVAMLTTVAADGAVHSRPMLTARTNFDGELWFFADLQDPKVKQIEANPQVNLGYACPESEQYVSVSGTASVIQDDRKAEALWEPAYEEWFPEGVEHSRLRLIKVTVDHAEYWDYHKNRMVQLAEYLNSKVTGDAVSQGEHASISWPKQEGAAQ